MMVAVPIDKIAGGVPGKVVEADERSLNIFAAASRLLSGGGVVFLAYKVVPDLPGVVLRSAPVLIFWKGCNPFWLGLIVVIGRSTTLPFTSLTQQKV